MTSLLKTSASSFPTWQKSPDKARSLPTKYSAISSSTSVSESRFCVGQCKFRDINTSLCERFRLYLLRAKGLQHTKKKLSKNSASAYFNAFLSIVHFAYRDNILSEDYTTCIEKIKWNHDIPKEYLSSAEIKQLASTPYDDNPDVYRAGMFSIYTGLRRSDILALRWENIHHDHGRKAYIRFRLKKTRTLIQ